MDLRQVATRVAAPTLSPQGCTSLVSLLSLLGAAAQLHQLHHWQVTGEQYYGDHILLQRIYEDSGAFIDQLAEKTVGHFGVIPPVEFVQAVGQFVTNFAPQALEPTYMMVSSLEIEKTIISTIDSVRQALEASGELSNGMDNLLQGIADKHEEFIYLLQQRVLKHQ
jgi:DNA-binding ferritin-like protein